MPRAKGGSIPPPRPVVPERYGGVISELRENDVLSGRGGRINNHPGNIMFRTVVEDYKREYLDPRTRKLEKAHVAARLVAQIRSTNPPGRFLKEDPDNPGKYIEIGDTKAWKKAGQALREDAPDVRKEMDEEMENVEYYPPPPRYHPTPHGIPPSVSYSPNSGPNPLGHPGHRPDPPASGASGYRQPPLPYLESGRGQMRPGPWAGRGPPPPPPRQPQFQQQQHNMGPPPPLNHVMSGQRPYPQPPHGGMHHNGYPPPDYYGQGHPPPPHMHQNPNQPYPHQPPPYGYPNQPLHSRPYPPQSGPPVHNGQPCPQDHRKSRASTSPVPPIFSTPINAVAAGLTQTMDAVSGLTSKVKQHVSGKPSEAQDASGKGQLGQSSTRRQVGKRNSDFPFAASTATNFTMSDVSEVTSDNPFASPENQNGTNQQQGPSKPAPVGKESSETTKTSSNKSRESVMSELSISGINMSYASMGNSFAMSGRTRSFPDLLLSTGEPPSYTAPLAESDKDNSDTNDDQKTKRSKSGRLLRPTAHRASSSESSASSMASIRFDRNFHPVRGRSNTGLSISALNDAMSIMSMDSKKSTSDSSSWLDAFKSMQSINSDTNPWEQDGSMRPQPWNDDGSIRSLLTDVSSDLNALDLAEPLLPPYPSDSGLDDSGFLIRPDP